MSQQHADPIMTIPTINEKNNNNNQEKSGATEVPVAAAAPPKTTTTEEDGADMIIVSASTITAAAPAKFDPGWRFYACFTSLCIISLAAALDATSLSVALPVRRILSVVFLLLGWFFYETREFAEGRSIVHAKKKKSQPYHQPRPDIPSKTNAKPRSSRASSTAAPSKPSGPAHPSSSPRPSSNRHWPPCPPCSAANPSSSSRSASSPSAPSSVPPPARCAPC